MSKIVFLVLCVLFNSFRASSAPIIKASGVQWSEPKGSGKGNITLIMIPQNNTAGDDSDMIVAVKSDYQILSQETQLLNLVVDEKDSNTITSSENVKELPKCVQPNNNVNYPNSNLKHHNTAKYFEPEAKLLPLTNRKNNTSSNIDPTLLGQESNMTQRVSETTQNYSTINIFNFSNSADSHSEKYIEDNNRNPNYMLLPTNSSNLKSIVEQNSENLTKLANTDQKFSNITTLQASLSNSTDNANNQSFAALKIIQQNSPYHMERTKFNEDFFGGGENKRTNEEPVLNFKLDLPHSLDSVETVEKEPVLQDFHKNNKLGFIGNLGGNYCLTSTTTNCLTCTGNRATNFMPESGSSTNSIRPANEGKSTNAYESHNEQSFGTPFLAPQGGKGSNVKLEQFNTPPSTEECRTIIVQCNPSKDVFDQISQMVTSKNENPFHENAVTNLVGAGSVGLPKIQKECVTVSNNDYNKPQAAKQEVQKKITLEPPRDCKAIIKAKEESTNKCNQNIDNAELIEEDLANNKETAKDQRILLALNNSLDELSVSGVKTKGEPVYNIAQLYNNNPLVFRIENGVLADVSKPFEQDNNDNVKLLYNKGVYKDQMFDGDINQLLKMHSARKLISQEQKPSYRSEISDKHCDPTPKSDSSRNELEPDNDELSPSDINSVKTVTAAALNVAKPKENYTKEPQTKTEKSTTTQVLQSTQQTDDDIDSISINPVGKTTKLLDLPRDHTTTKTLKGLGKRPLNSKDSPCDTDENHSIDFNEKTTAKISVNTKLGDDYDEEYKTDLTTRTFLPENTVTNRKDIRKQEDFSIQFGTKQFESKKTNNYSTIACPKIRFTTALPNENVSHNWKKPSRKSKPGTMLPHKKDMCVPVNNVQEIVIKLIKTRKPGRVTHSGSHMCYNNVRNDLKSVELAQSKINNVQKHPEIIMYRNALKNSSGSKLNIMIPNEQKTEKHSQQSNGENHN